MYFENREQNSARGILRAKNRIFHSEISSNSYLYHRLNALADLIADQQLSHSEVAEYLREEAAQIHQYK